MDPGQVNTAQPGGSEPEKGHAHQERDQQGPQDDLCGTIRAELNRDGLRVHPFVFIDVAPVIRDVLPLRFPRRKTRRKIQPETAPKDEEPPHKWLLSRPMSSPHR